MSDPKTNGGNRGEAAASIYHGGDLAQIRARFPDAPEPWIDLSTGIDPIAWAVPPLPPEVWTRLPEPASVARLEAVAAAAFGVADPACVAAVPGT
ncbi:MAG: threonine-phosphate decarboxylase, partial [Phyllobacteriaceae bacterium]|nr:threonine-phosphate decarboxylase [Phyllobacteriaceae bacterium]